MKILRRLGNEDAMVDSASRLVVMYLRGKRGAPAAAEMKTKDLTFWKDASCARVIATSPVFSCIKTNQSE